MALTLGNRLRWTSATPSELASLLDLQGNILKGHGRDHTRNLFVRFTDAAEGRAFLRAVANCVTSAKQQLDEAKSYKDTKKSGKVFTSVVISHDGYTALGIPAGQTPGGAAFAAGLKARQADLNDPTAAQWEPQFQGELHALILVGGVTPAEADAQLNAILSLKPASVVVVTMEPGLGMRNPNGDGIEHFGYVDGRSQPLVLEEDVEVERDEKDGITVWHPGQPLQQALVPCPGGGADSYGSYFVYRKLEQNVKGFKEAEEKLAEDLKLKGADEERAGALVVGRFEDGTPVVNQKADGNHNPVPNNFDYKTDPGGQKCPFHGHIRKTNPRGDSTKLGATIEQEREHMILRRGITYGTRAAFLTDRPEKDVGLIFMCFQSSIENQFEFMQRFWANNEDFVNPATGIDPVIGQRPAGQKPTEQSWPLKWGEAAKKPAAFEGYVTMKGGEYFFAPCISFLRSL